MEASNSMGSIQVRRLVIFAIIGALLVAAAYLWVNRLSAAQSAAGPTSINIHVPRVAAASSRWIHAPRLAAASSRWIHTPRVAAA